MASPLEDMAREWLKDLFSNGWKQRAYRLVLHDEEERDLGGWCEGAVRDRLLPLLARVQREERERCREVVKNRRDQLAAQGGCGDQIGECDEILRRLDEAE